MTKDNSHKGMNHIPKLTIIHAASFASAYGGNFIASIRALDLVLKKKGWTFILALPSAAAKRDWCTKLIAQGYHVRFLPDCGSVWRFTSALSSIALSSEATIIHTHFSQYDVAAWATMCFLRFQRRHLHVIWHAHSDFPVQLTLLRRLRNILKYRIMGHTVRMIAVSEHLREQMIAAGFRSKGIRTVQNGIALDRAVETTRSRTQVCEEYNFSSDNRLLLLFGWEPTVKGVDIAMDACKILIDHGLPVILGVVGTSALKEFVSNRTAGAIPSWLRILPPIEDVAWYYQAASVFVSASRSEGFPYSIGEAMVNRLPVVLSDLPGVTWAHKTPGAIFFPPGDCEAMAAAIREVLDWTAEERVQRAMSNEHLVRTQYAVAAWATQINNFYLEAFEE